MEGPVDPAGQSEYTEQTLDADSQVGSLQCFVSVLFEMKLGLCLSCKILTCFNELFKQLFYVAKKLKSIC